MMKEIWQANNEFDWMKQMNMQESSTSTSKNIYVYI